MNVRKCWHQDTKRQRSLLAINANTWHQDTAQIRQCSIHVASGMSVWNKYMLLQWINYGTRKDCSNDVCINMDYFRIHNSKDDLMQLLMALPFLYSQNINIAMVNDTSIQDMLKIVHAVKAENLMFRSNFKFTADHIRQLLLSDVAITISFGNVHFDYDTAEEIAANFAEWTLFHNKGGPDSRMMIAISGVVHNQENHPLAETLFYYSRVSIVPPQ
jgi:hypothetical protein